MNISVITVIKKFKKILVTQNKTKELMRVKNKVKMNIFKA